MKLLSDWSLYAVLMTFSLISAIIYNTVNDGIISVNFIEVFY